MHVTQDSMWRRILKTFWFSGWTKQGLNKALGRAGRSLFGLGRNQKTFRPKKRAPSGRQQGSADKETHRSCRSSAEESGVLFRERAGSTPGAHRVHHRSILRIRRTKHGYRALNAHGCEICLCDSTSLHRAYCSCVFLPDPVLVI